MERARAEAKLRPPTFALRPLSAALGAEIIGVDLSEEIDDLTARMKHAVQSTAPTLLDQHGVGPDIAACLLIAAGDNPERLHSEAAFTALAGVSPVEASSG